MNHHSLGSHTGKGFLNRAINALPFELHIPGYQFCGPGTKLTARLARGDRGINPLDTACREHDIAYSRYKDLENRHKADHVLADRALHRITSGDATLGEKVSATAVLAAMKAKTKLGMGLIKKKGEKKKKTTKRILPIAKRGGFLPLLLPALSAIGALTGGAAGVVKAINAAKAAKKQLQEAERHNRAMEGRGIHLAPYKHGKGLKEKKKKQRRRTTRRQISN
ncbi:uncharacterized protein LOC143220349 [Lasioglossum baleicum]|uniref:uncharacterized protein LOC143220349 n=1 Tax=Lasioglossum baleicum TaxID=434251 RepID=UPI003FCE4DF6